MYTQNNNTKLENIFSSWNLNMSKDDYRTLLQKIADVNVGTAKEMFSFINEKCFIVPVLAINNIYGARPFVDYEEDKISISCENALHGFSIQKVDGVWVINDANIFSTRNYSTFFDVYSIVKRVNQYEVEEGVIFQKNDFLIIANNENGNRFIAVEDFDTENKTDIYRIIID